MLLIFQKTILEIGLLNIYISDDLIKHDIRSGRKCPDRISCFVVCSWKIVNVDTASLYNKLAGSAVGILDDVDTGAGCGGIDTAA